MNLVQKKIPVKIWALQEVLELYDTPFMDLIYQAQTVHRHYFPEFSMQLSTLSNIKTGGCSEDCQYCPQSSHYHTGVKSEKLLSANVVKEEAEAAKEAGATRFCMGAAWRSLKDRDVPKIADIVRTIKALGLETCMTLGMLTEEQALALKEAGLDYYNHNLDTSPEYYSEIISTRTYEDRLTTLAHVRNAGLKVCCGGIIGMGETREDRAHMLVVLANMDPGLESVPINKLVPIPGTPLEKAPPLDNFEFIRTIAVARILMPQARVRLSAGRMNMSDEMQTLCFMAGANSIFYGEKLLMTENPQITHDRELLKKLQVI